jgi:hypothetical protein
MVLLMPTLVLQRPLLLAARGARPALARPLSILGTIFGIGEFEGERNQSLRGSTGKQHAFELALLDVRFSLSVSLDMAARYSCVYEARSNAPASAAT